MTEACDRRSGPDTFQYSPCINVAYDLHGRGNTPIVALHSLGSAKESWDSLTPGLLAACNCRIYRLDLKGHGETSAPEDHDYSLGANTAIVRAFMLARGLHGVVLMGHSYGGAVALNLALQTKNEFPGLVRGIILMGTPGVFQRFPFVVAQQRYESCGRVIDRITTSKMRAWIAVHATSYGRSETVRNRLRLYGRLWSDPVHRRAARETARQFLDGGDLKELGSCDHCTGVPTLLVAGRYDRVVGLKRMRELAASIPGANVAVIDTGHALHEDVPESVLPVVANFLQSLLP